MPRLRLIGVLINIGQSLLSLHGKVDRMTSKLDDLKAANTAEGAAVSTALAAILALQAQHQEDLAKLAAITPADDSGDLATLTASMQDRAKSITDALSTLQAQVSPAADTPAAAETGSATAETGTAAPVADPAPAADPAATGA